MKFDAYRWARREVFRRNDPEGEPSLRLTPKEGYVLTMLADHFNDEWARAWPSQATLARETGFDQSSVHRAVAGLRNRGLVVTERWKPPTGRESLRYLLPEFRPDVRPATIQPVHMLPSWSGLEEDGYDEYRRIPGTNLMIRGDALD